MAVGQEQYRPVSTLETATNSALSVRAIRHFCEAINNLKYYVLAHKTRSIICFPPWESKFDTTAERVIAVLLCPRIPDGFSVFRWECGHARVDGSGSTLWKIYCSAKRYDGPSIFDSDYLGPSYDSDSFTSSSDTHARANDRLLTIYRDIGGYPWLTITSTSSDTSTRSHLTSIDLVPRK